MQPGVFVNHRGGDLTGDRVGRADECSAGSQVGLIRGSPAASSKVGRKGDECGDGEEGDLCLGSLLR